MPRTVPTVRQRRLGRDLRRLREDRDLSADRVAAQLGWSGSKVTRIETATTKVTPADVALMLDLYGVRSDQRAALLELAHEAQQRGWWTEYGDVFATSYVPLEDEAGEMKVFETILVPGLLQTDDYARAVIAATLPGASSDDIERRVRARAARKALLTRDDAPRLMVVIAKPVLLWPIGGPGVMRNQVRALDDAGRRPNVTIRILPETAGAHAGLDGPFTIFSFGDDDFPDVCFAEGPAGGNYVESRDQVERITLNWNGIVDQSLSVEQSATFIADLAEE